MTVFTDTTVFIGVAGTGRGTHFIGKEKFSMGSPEGITGKALVVCTPTASQTIRMAVSTYIIIVESATGTGFNASF